MNHALPLYSESIASPVQQRRDGPIRLEHRWRNPDVGGIARCAESGIVLSRWTRDTVTPLAVAHSGSRGQHCIALNLKCTSVTFAHDGKTLIRGRVAAGAAQVTAPDVACSAVFDAPADVLHLFATQQVLSECFEDVFGRPHAGEVRIDNAKLVRDPALERLGQALAVSQSDDAALGQVFTDSVSLAIVSRVVARHFATAVKERREVSALPAWRLSRAIEFVDAHLAEPIGLAEMAASAGLTRMHFASQFRRATGMRPHEYLLRRRIESAQRLLRDSAHNVLDVALCCGFRSQAHFTTVFKRFVGATPHSWRIKANVD